MLARAIAGRVPRYRTGGAIRAALDAAGAHAATVDGTLHLPAPPDTSPRALGVVAHELSHVAEGGHHAHERPRPAHPGRPRFLLDRLSGVTDAGERQARQVGALVRERATRSLPALPAASGMPGVTELPVMSGLPGLRDVLPPDIASLPVGGPVSALSAARQALGDAREAASGLGERAVAEAGGMLGPLPGVPPLPAAAGSAVDALAGRVGDPGALLPSAAGGESAVGGVRGAADTVTSGLQAAVSEATSTAGDPDSRIGALMEALEERLLIELERRGGRYAGVF